VSGDRGGRRPARPLPPEGGPDPHRLDSAIDAYLSDSGFAGARAIVELTRHWPHVVGEEVAPHCRPVTLIDGVLRVQVDHPVWATGLSLASAHIVERAASWIGAGNVRAINVHVLGGFG
jgi:predicted nucleic acid-binding Zn ribbon protein